MEHFADYTNKGNTLRSQVYDLSYELTGSELIALLLESFEIKRLRPSVNRAQRRQYFPYGIHTFTDAQGYLRMEVVKLTATNRKNLQLITECPSPAHGRSRLEAAFHNFELCQRLAGLSFGTGACFYYHLQQCKGACVGQESSEDYNDRAAAAIDRLRTTFEEDFFLVEPGREAGERAVVLVENGQYRGFGFIGPDDEGEEAWRRAIKRVEPNPECNRIVQGFMAGNKVVKVKVN